MCYEDGDGSISSAVGAEEDDVDDENTTKYLKRMIAYFQTLSSKKELSKENVTSIRVYNAQVTALQSMMEPQPLVLQKWECYCGHLLIEARSNIDDVAFKIVKLHDDDVKIRSQRRALLDLEYNFVKARKRNSRKHRLYGRKRSIGNCIGMTQMLHHEKELNELSRLFLDFYLKSACIMSLVELTKIVTGNISDVTVDTMQHCASTIAEKNIASLLMEVRETKKYDICKFLDRIKCEALTILRKHKYKDRTIEESVKINL